MVTGRLNWVTGRPSSVVAITSNARAGRFTCDGSRISRPTSLVDADTAVGEEEEEVVAVALGVAPLVGMGLFSPSTVGVTEGDTDGALVEDGVGDIMAVATAVPVGLVVDEGDAVAEPSAGRTDWALRDPDRLDGRGVGGTVGRLVAVEVGTPVGVLLGVGVSVAVAVLLGVRVAVPATMGMTGCPAA